MALRRFVEACLRGSGQVMFQDHPVTGFLFLAGIAWGALAAGTPAVLAGAVWGLAVATATALWLRADEASFRRGLFGYNGLLVGAGLPTFLADHGLLWVYVTVGAAVSTVVFMALANVFKTWECAALTAPFVLVAWVLVLGAYALAGLPSASLPAPTMPHHLAAPATVHPQTARFWIESLLNGPAQVIFQGNAVTGALFLAGLAVSSRAAAGLALLGSLVGLGVAASFGADARSLQAGLFGFCPVLTAIALGGTFYPPSGRVLAFALLGTVFTVFAQAALNVALMPLGVPAFTAAFVLTTWLFLLARGDLAPLPHEPVRESVFGPRP